MWRVISSSRREIRESKPTRFVYPTAVPPALKRGPKTFRLCPFRFPVLLTMTLLLMLCRTWGVSGIPRAGSVEAQVHGDNGPRLIPEGTLDGADTDMRVTV